MNECQALHTTTSLAVQTSNLRDLDIEKLVIISIFQQPYEVVRNLFLVLLILQFMDMNSLFTEISRKTLFPTLMKMYGNHILGLRKCEYILFNYGYQQQKPDSIISSFLI